MDGPLFVNPFIARWTFGLFLLLTMYYEWHSMDIHAQVFLWTYVPCLLIAYLGVDLGHMGALRLVVLRKWQTLQRGCPVHIPTQSRSVLSSSHRHQHCSFCPFDDSRPSGCEVVRNLNISKIPFCGWKWHKIWMSEKPNRENDTYPWLTQKTTVTFQV